MGADFFDTDKEGFRENKVVIKTNDGGKKILDAPPINSKGDQQSW